jgi:ABC-2 type transport system permease protein/oleandomycin transport system permease protein
MPGWLRAFADHQPVSVATDAIRGLADGTSSSGDVWYALVWVAVMLVVFVPLASRLYAKT